jgi:hypothetical protein
MFTLDEDGAFREPQLPDEELGRPDWTVRPVDRGERVKVEKLPYRDVDEYLDSIDATRTDLDDERY